MKTEDELQEMADRASDLINSCSDRFRGMTYAEGVRIALEWAMGVLDDGETPLD